MLKIILCILMVCVLLTLAACGTADTPSTQPNMENSTPGTAPTDSTAPSSSQTQQTEPSSTATEATDPTETTNATEPTETEPTEPTVETVPVRPQGTVYITAPLDIFANAPEEAGDVQMNIAEGYLFIKDLDDVWYHTYGGIGTNQFCIIVQPMVQDPVLKEKNILCEARTNWPGLYRSYKDYYSHTALMEISFTGNVVWMPDNPTEENLLPEQIWVDVAVYADDNIVGMAVYAIDLDEKGKYIMTLLYSECYEMIDGEYQYITEEFVNARIEAYHQYALGNRE